MTISYSSEPQLSTSEFADILRRTTLGDRRPVDNSARLAGMLAQADVIVTAQLLMEFSLVYLAQFLIFTIARICLTWPSMRTINGRGSANS